MGVYVLVYCQKRDCEFNVNGKCEAHDITLVEVGDYEFKCQENTVRY